MDYQFPVLKGVPYLRYLARMHRHLLPNWYLEVGTNTGRSLAKATCNSIAVDPNFIISTDVIGSKPSVHFFQSTSDDFFSAGHTKRLCDKVDMAFLDGLHLFEFLLRDFMGTEKLCDTDSVIAMHDCIPMTYIAAERHWDTKATKSWTGDVWKVVPILKKYRPDLKIEVLDCPPSGLTIVTNLDPENDVLDKHYDEIIAEFMEVSLSDYGEERLISELEIVPSRLWPANRHVGGIEPNVGFAERNLLRKVAAKPASPKLHLHKPISFSIKNPARTNDKIKANSWGESFFAEGLANALRRRGHDADIHFRRHWNAGEGEGTDIVLRTVHLPFERSASRNCLIWNIYGTNLSDEEIDSADHVFVASKIRANELKTKVGPEKVSTLYQAFDADRMSSAGPSMKSSLLFVGSNHNKKSMRKSVQMCLQHGANLDIYGKGWEESKASKFVRSDFIGNNELAQHYRGASAVLNDHYETMGLDGFVSNRIFDVLACGSAIISDTVAGLPEDIYDWVDQYGDKGEFSAILDKLLSESAGRQKERIGFAEEMKQLHSFDQRAAEIIEVARATKISGNAPSRKQHASAG